MVRRKQDDFPKISQYLIDIAVNDTGNLARLAHCVYEIMNSRAGSVRYGEAFKQLKAVAKHVVAVNAQRQESPHE